MYVVIPISYWGLNVYDAKTFPIFSSHLYDALHRTTLLRLLTTSSS
jgi:hypothetical protein